MRRTPRPVLDRATTRTIQAYVAEDASRLRELTGERFESWSV